MSKPNDDGNNFENLAVELKTTEDTYGPMSGEVGLVLLKMLNSIGPESPMPTAGIEDRIEEIFQFYVEVCSE